MKSLILFLAFFQIFLSCSNESQTPVSIINKLIENYSKKNSISYDLIYTNKSESFSKPAIWNAKANIIKNKSDSIFNSKFNFSYLFKFKDKEFRREYFYVSDSIYSLNFDDKIIKKYNNSNTDIITNNFHSDILKSYFLNPEKLIYFIENDSNYTSEIKLVNLDNEECYHICFKYNINSEEMKDYKYQIWITKTYYIKKIRHSRIIGGLLNYYDFLYSNVEFDEISVNDIESRLENYKKDFELIIYKDDNSEEKLPEPLSVNTKAPDFKGKYFQKDKEIKLSDSKNKVLILDFWYIGCYPCVKAIPKLVELKKNYGEKIEILGLNSYDTKENQKEILRKFIENQKINYPVIQIEKQVAKDYKIYSYPSIFILDKNKKIKKQFRGFNKFLKDSLEKYIDIELKK